MPRAPSTRWRRPTGLIVGLTSRLGSPAGADDPSRTSLPASFRMCPSMSVAVRATTYDDREQVLDVVRLSFAASGRGEDEEAQIVAQTWELDAVPDGLDLVADDDGVIVGHVMAARGRLAEKDALGIAPLCVSPSHQRQGVGTALMRAIIDKSQAAGWPFVVLLGDPAYYGRFGFEAAGPLGIVYEPVGADSVHFQIRTLHAFDVAAWRGTFRYAGSCHSSCAALLPRLTGLMP